VSNQVLDAARQRFLAGDGTVMWSATPNLKTLLCDADQAFHTGGAAGGYRITGVTNAANPTLTTAAAHGLAVNDVITISGVGGATGVNNSAATPTWIVASTPTSNTFTITTSAPGAYTSGGYLYRVSDTFLSDSFPAASQIARSAAMTSITNTNGVAGAANIAYASVGAITGQANGTAEWIVVAQTNIISGVDLADTAARIIYFIDTGTGLPVTPNGGAININWSVAPAGLFKL